MAPPPPLYMDFFWPPLTEDVEELLGRFQQSGSVRYELFSALWRDMGFSQVFHGIPAAVELRRFCRVAMATAVKYFLPPYSYQIRVGGLYLMHAFYHTQLAAPPVKIRLALKDWHHVQKFLCDTVEAAHHDVAYVLRRLHATNAIHYTVMPHFLSFKRYLKEKREAPAVEFVCRSTRVQDLLSRELLEEVSNVQSHYEKIKSGLAKDHGHLGMTHGDLPDRLRGCVEEYGSWQTQTFSRDRNGGDINNRTDAEEEEEEEKESSARARRVASIKKKGYQTYADVAVNRHVHTARRPPHRGGPDDADDMPPSPPNRPVHTTRRPPHRRDPDDAGYTPPSPPKRPPPKRWRPPSLRERTFEKLGQQKNTNLYHWLLSVPTMGKNELNQSRKDRNLPYVLNADGRIGNKELTGEASQK